jgi:hypothetical protein
VPDTPFQDGFTLLRTGLPAESMGVWPFWATRSIFGHAVAFHLQTNVEIELALPK